MVTWVFPEHGIQGDQRASNSRWEESNNFQTAKNRYLADYKPNTSSPLVFFILLFYYYFFFISLPFINTLVHRSSPRLIASISNSSCCCKMLSDSSGLTQPPAMLVLALVWAGLKVAHPGTRLAERSSQMPPQAPLHRLLSPSLPEDTAHPCRSGTGPCLCQGSAGFPLSLRAQMKPQWRHFCSIMS